MKLKYKLFTSLLLSSATALSIYFINNLTKYKALENNFFKEQPYFDYAWRLGNIKYKKSGRGNPLLLIHDLDTAASSYEWHRLINALSKTHTVYALDLLGCGLSEKPDISYTNFLYTQLITDFIKQVIAKRSSVMVTASSTAFVSMSCKMNPQLFDKIIFISPEDLYKGSLIPGKRAKLYKSILNMPLIGTLIYHIASFKKTLARRLKKNVFSENFYIPNKIIDVYHESAHLGDSPKSLYASILCHYTKCNTKEALSSINNSIFIFGGTEDKTALEIIKDYRNLNPSIEYTLIPKVGKFPHLENPAAFLKELYPIL